MKIIGDVEQVNLATGQRWVRVTGDGESRLAEQGAKCPYCGHQLHEGVSCLDSDCCRCGQ